MIRDYLNWCYSHSNAGYLLLVATALGVVYLIAGIIGAWNDRD